MQFASFLNYFIIPARLWKLRFNLLSIKSVNILLASLCTAALSLLFLNPLILKTDKSDSSDVNIEIGDKLPKQKATTVGSEDEDGENPFRLSEISWISDNPETEWIYRKISEYAKIANKEMWNFDIWGYQDHAAYLQRGRTQVAEGSGQLLLSK